MTPSDINAAWMGSRSKIVKALRPSLGFAFSYRGQIVGPQFTDEWKISEPHDLSDRSTKVVVAHPSGLEVTRMVRRFEEFDAAEYSLRLKNVGSLPLSPVEALQALSLVFSGGMQDGSRVIASGGGLMDGYLPPRSFAIRECRFAPTVRDAGTVDLGTEGGRSSNKDLPFFFVHHEALGEGLFVALGWSGQWSASIQRDPASEALSLKAGIPDIQIALDPGEEIEGPTVLVGFFTGSAIDGANRLRRLIKERYAPALAGRKHRPVATYDHWWNIYEDFDEALLKRLADSAASIGQEYFLIDAAWYDHPPKEEGGWREGVGNWEIVNAAKFPNGLGPIADYVRSKGLQFGLWFEPERVAPGTKLATEHPDWILWAHEERENSFNSIIGASHGLLNYGRCEVQEWVCAMMDRYITELGVRYIRYDFNLDPLPYWEAHDGPSRRGLTQLRHIHGFYRIIDWIRARHPETVLEGCASGGRRIDLETVRRFHTAFISDYTVDPSIVRFHLHGINHFLPGSYSYVQYTLPAPHQRHFAAADIDFQSMFAGSFGTGGRIDLWSETMKEKARLHVSVWKKLRRYMMEDYYPLTAQPGDLSAWSAWQFHDPADQSGFVQAFRPNALPASHRFFLRGLAAERSYRLADAYGGEVFEISGTIAVNEGIEITQEPMRSTVLMYEPVR